MIKVALIITIIGWCVGATAIYTAKDALATGDWWFDMLGLVISFCLLTFVSLNFLISAYGYDLSKKKAKEKDNNV